MVERGCGRRKAGGIYLEAGLSPDGLPLEHFLIDPPLAIDDPAALGVSPIGVTLIERDGVAHVLDWVGSEHYPNVCDVVEEGRAWGFSRRVAGTLDFSRLGPGSRLILIHARAHIADPAPYWAAIGARRMCPQVRALGGAHLALDYRGMCAGLWWHDVEGGVALSDRDGDRRVHRRLPSVGYAAYRRPALPPGDAPAYRPAMFLSLPLTGIAVINDPTGGAHQAALARAGRAGLPVRLADE
jgi:hypothetical protein